MYSVPSSASGSAQYSAHVGNQSISCWKKQRISERNNEEPKVYEISVGSPLVGAFVVMGFQGVGGWLHATQVWSLSTGSSIIFAMRTRKPVSAKGSSPCGTLKKSKET